VSSAVAEMKLGRGIRGDTLLLETVTAAAAVEVSKEVQVVFGGDKGNVVVVVVDEA
jgi:hypothetical protein